MSAVQNIGLMMTYNEADIIEETMRHLSRFFDKILVLDGSSDKTEEIIRSFDNVVYFLKDQDIFPRRKIADGARQFLLEKAQERYGTHGWFTVLHADEFFVDDPNEVATRAEMAGAEKVNWHTLNFFLHTRLANAVFPAEKADLSVLKYFAPGGLEIRQFRNKPGLFYDLNLKYCVLPQGIGWKMLWDFPTIRHYVERSPAQMKKKHTPDTRMSYHPDDGATAFRDRYSPHFKTVMVDDGRLAGFAPGTRPSFLMQYLRFLRYR